MEWEPSTISGNGHNVLLLQPPISCVITPSSNFLSAPRAAAVELRQFVQEQDAVAVISQVRGPPLKNLSRIND